MSACILSISLNAENLFMVAKLPAVTNSVDKIKHLFSLIPTDAAPQFLGKLISYLLTISVKGWNLQKNQAQIIYGT